MKLTTKPKFGVECVELSESGIGGYDLDTLCEFASSSCAPANS